METSGECVAAGPSDEAKASTGSADRAHLENKNGFQKPRIEPQVIKRRLKVVTRVHRGSAAQHDRPVFLGDKPKVEGHQTRPRLPLVPMNQKREKMQVDNLEMDQVSSEDGLPSRKGEKLWDVSPGQENPSGSGLTLAGSRFGQLKMHKRKTSSIEPTAHGSKASVVYPFSPLVSRTRGYARLDGAAKAQRLQRLGFPVKRPSRVQGEEPRPKKMYQERMEAFLPTEAPPTKEKASTCSLSETKGEVSCTPAVIHLHVHTCTRSKHLIHIKNG